MTKYLVFGHKNPDMDTIASAIAFAYFLEKEGHDAEPVALGKVDTQTAFALERFGFDAPRVVETVADETTQVALVDHNEPQQSADDIDNVVVDYVIDHHRISGFTTNGPVFYRAEPIGSTASVLYKMFNEYGYEIPAEMAGIMLSAIISDTLLFKSPTTTAQDEKIGAALAELAGVNLNDYGLELLKSGADISKVSDEDLVEGDAKNFQMGKKSVRIGQIETIGFDEVFERKTGLMEVMAEKRRDMSLDLYLLVITDILENTSRGIAVGEDLSVVEQAFDIEVSDNEFNLDGIVSRKKQVVPPLTNIYEEADVE